MHYLFVFMFVYVANKSTLDTEAGGIHCYMKISCIYGIKAHEGLDFTNV